MSIDYLSCKRCNNAFPDCNDYVSCDCGNIWCDDECAEKDGLTIVEIADLEIITCKYCRGEDFDDSDLLEYVLKRLGMTRDYIIKEYKEDLK